MGTNGKQVGPIHFEPPPAERRQNSVCPGVTVETVSMAVAFDVGFQETSVFTTAFRKLAGRTPSDYRRSLAQKRV